MLGDITVAKNVYVAMNSKSLMLIRKVVSIVIIVAIILQTGFAKTVMANTVDTFTYKGDGYEITYTIEDSWDNGYKADIKIKNTSNSVINNWSLCFIIEGKIINIWNAKIESELDGKDTINGVNENQNIKSGETIDFGFITNCSKAVIPKLVFFQSKKTIADNKDYYVDYKILDDWTKGFNGQFSINNKSNQCIKDWLIEFD